MSNFIVSARKYRPHRFEDVVGQEHVSQTLKNALQNDQLAHSFLFCGPRGVGKTTCARILAKLLNCENKSKDFEACNECSSCTSFNDNASFNITELDAASNNSVEHIRTLIEQVRFQPQQGKYKVFIIDEVHMLSSSAFNAFLKTLEEPPPYAVFILATTEKHKIIPTILSRCQIFDFRRIQVHAIVKHLEGICKLEKIKAEPEALHIIAQKADGALRDALSIFDRIVSFSGKKIVYDDVIDNLNVLDYDYYFTIVDALMQEDVSNVLLTFDGILKKGFDPDIFLNGMAEHLRNILVCQDKQTLALLEVSDSLKKQYQNQAAAAAPSFLLTALNIINDCDVNYKMARNKRLHVEMALIKIAYINRAVELAKSGTTEEKKTLVSQPIATKGQKNPKAEKPITTAPVKKEAAPTPEKKKTATTLKDKDLSAVVQANTSYDTPTLMSLDALKDDVQNYEKNQVTDDSDLTQENLEEGWAAFAEKLISPSMKNCMETAQVTLEGTKINVLVPSKMSKSMLVDESELMPFLRTKLNTKLLSMEIVVDESLAPKDVLPKAKKILTVKEKYEAMVKENPQLEVFRTRFNLKVDNS